MAALLTKGMHSCSSKWAFASTSVQTRRAKQRVQTLAVASPLTQQQVVTTLHEKKYHASPLSQTAPSTYAVIEVGGVQMFVEPNKRYRCNRLKVEEGSTVQFPRVLLAKSDGTPHFGSPYVGSATVQAEIVEHLKGDKIIVYKMKPKKHYRKKYGHRQHLTTFKVTDISVEGAKEELQVSQQAIDDMLAAAIEKKRIGADSKDAFKKQLSSPDAATRLKTLAHLVL